MRDTDQREPKPTSGPTMPDGDGRQDRHGRVDRRHWPGEPAMPTSPDVTRSEQYAEPARPRTRVGGFR